MRTAEVINSNTTLVKVKLFKGVLKNEFSWIQIQLLLKLNFTFTRQNYLTLTDSNTTLVKVKCYKLLTGKDTKIFKYNSC